MAADNDDGIPLYIQRLKQIAETEEYTLDVDCKHIFQFSQ